MIGSHFQQHSENLQAREALLYAFSNLNEKCWLH